jgi:hypothetical protein
LLSSLPIPRIATFCPFLTENAFDLGWLHLTAPGFLDRGVDSLAHQRPPRNTAWLDCPFGDLKTHPAHRLN